MRKKWRELNQEAFPSTSDEFKADWPAQYPSVVIAVEDLAAAMARVTRAGGEVLGEPMTIPGIGDYVAFFDTERNRHSMLKPVPPTR